MSLIHILDKNSKLQKEVKLFGLKGSNKKKEEKTVLFLTRFHQQCNTVHLSLTAVSFYIS